ncbi:MAG: hypothetical protein WC491_07125, partial [Candidatus Omnitrophota bacterium]
NLLLQPAGGNIGIGGTFDGNPTTLAPSYMISLDGQAGRTVGMERNQAAGQTGNDFTVQAGGAYATGSDLNGGNLILKAGTATGAGASAIMFQTAKAGAAGAADNDPATKAIIAGTSMTLSPHGTAAGNTLELRFNELAAGGVNYVGFKAPDAIGSDLIWTLPAVDGSPGNVLKTDGSGTLSFGAVGGSTAITGTTNDTFEVNSDGNSVTISSAGQTSDHVFTFPDATGQVLTNNMPADAAVALGGGVDALNFDSNTLSIDASSHRVGIGTASPQYNLDVVESARINNTAGAASLMLTGTGDAYAYSFVNLLNDTGNKSWNIQHRKAAGFVDDFIIEEYDGAAYSQRFIMRPGGIVGIGTTDFDGAPALGHLTVKGTTNDGTTNIFVGRDSDEVNVAYLDTDGNLTLSGFISASASSLSGTTADTFTVNSDGTAVASTLALGIAGTTGGSITTGAGNLAIDSAGGTIDINDGTIDLSTQAVDVTLNAAADALNFDSNTLSIDASSHRVGIGTASPLHALDIGGTARVKNSGGIGTLILEGTGDAYKYSALNLFDDTGNKLWAIQHRQIAGEVNNFAIEEYDGTDYTRRLSIIPGGYVGIPDMSPVAQLVIGNDAAASVSGAGSAYIQNDLEVDGTLTVATANIAGTTADTFTVNSDGTAVASTLALGIAGTTGGSITTGAGNLAIDSAGGTIDINDGTIDLSTQAVDVTLNAAADALNFDSNTLSIDASGNKVGIGTAAPDYLLTIAPPLNEVATIGMLSTSGSGAQINLGYSGSYSAAIGYNQNFEGAIEFKTGGTGNSYTKMEISGAGKVGIGTGSSTEPVAGLDVQNAVTAASANAYGARLQQTLTASANSDALTALYINPTFVDGGFTGVKHNGIAFPDAQAVKINFGYDAAKSKWLGIDSSWRMAFSDDSGFSFYKSTDNVSWGAEWMRIGDTIETYSDLLVGTSATNRWLKMRGNILFEENDDYIGTYNAGTFTLGNLQSTAVATTVNFGRDGGIDIMNFNRGGATYNFLTLSSAGTDDITIDPAGGDVSVDGNIATTSNGNITAGGSGSVQCGTGAFKSSDGTAGLTGTYNIDGSAAGTVATMQFKNGILVAVTTR